MSVYRDEACAFCDRGSRGRCPRCHAAVCEVHDAPGAPYCATCAKELRDDLDVLRFSVAVHEPPPDSVRGARRPGFVLAVVSLIDAVMLQLRERQARRAFDRRTPVDIAEWRRRAGIRVRGA